MNAFHTGWFMHPLVYGDYPPTMRRRAGARLPYFTSELSKRLAGSFDFIGLNHYNIFRTRADEIAFNLKHRDYYADVGIADPTEDIISGNVEYAPWALGTLLEHLKQKYGNPPIMIHENGYGCIPTSPSKIDYDDDRRSEVIQDYLEVLFQAIRNGSDTRGYFVWSFLDVFEFLYGNRLRYGLCGIDMNAEERTRYKRNSALWYSGFLKGGELRPLSSLKKANYDST